MTEVYKNWTQLKSILSEHNLILQYVEYTDKYIIFAIEGSVKYICEVWRDTSNIQGIDINQNNLDLVDFEDNYKNNANKPTVPIDVDGKVFVRSESRPIGKTTYFTCSGDSVDNIGDGKELKWDFSNSNDDISAPEGFKRKRLEFNFIDSINLKEGTIYFYDAPKGCYLHLHIVCPDGEVYLDSNGEPQVASGDTIINTFVNKYFVQGDCPMGDELNTETSSKEIPTNYKLWIDITTIDSDTLSSGHVSLELYRSRTRIL